MMSWIIYIIGIITGIIISIIIFYILAHVFFWLLAEEKNEELIHRNDKYFSRNK